MKFMKGYTLIELGIVLLIMGVLASIGTKGYGMIHRAKTVSNINKILVFEHALKAYESRNGIYRKAMPAYGTGMIPNLMLELRVHGLLVQGDMDAMAFRKGAPANHLSYYSCKAVKDGDLDNRSLGFAPSLAPSSSAPNIARAMEICIVFHADYRNTCNIEQILDDKNIITGNGRIASDDDSENDNFRNVALGDNYTRCDRMSSVTGEYYSYSWFIR